MLFYFVRHGETLANRERRMAGSGHNIPLTEEGHRQAQVLATTLHKRVGHRLHRLCVSDLIRAQQTADYLARMLALPIETIGGLREWDLGEWEGQDTEKCVPLMLNGGEPAGGESRQIFYARVEQAWRSIHHPREPYLMVSHGGVWLALQDVLQIPRFRAGNCDLIKAEFDGTRWHAKVVA
jgi:broad specificity phosphatase PhoE